jgi:hypothetical protein
VRVQTACEAQRHILWVELRDGLSQADWDSILLDVEASACPRCLGTWSTPLAPTVDARAFLSEREIAGETGDPPMPEYKITTSDAPFAALPGSEYRVTWEATGPGGTRRDAFVGYFIEVVRFMGVDYATFDRHDHGSRYYQQTPISVITSLIEITETDTPDANTLLTPEVSTVTFDGPHATPTGGEMTRVVVFDGHGCEIGWMSIDTAGHGYGPTAEHPDRALLGFPRGFRRQPFSLYNNVDEGWACPSYEGAVEAALLEHAVRLAEDWYETSRTECEYEEAPLDAVPAAEPPRPRRNATGCASSWTRSRLA